MLLSNLSVSTLARCPQSLQERSSKTKFKTDFACWTSAAVVTSYAMGVGRMRSENRLCHRGKRRERLIALPLGWMLAFAAQEIRTAATHLATGA